MRRNMWQMQNWKTVESREEGTLQKVSVISSRSQVKLDAEEGEAQSFGTGTVRWNLPGTSLNDVPVKWELGLTALLKWNERGP